MSFVGWMAFAALILDLGYASAATLTPLKMDGSPSRALISLSDVRCEITSDTLKIQLAQKDGPDTTEVSFELPGYDAMKRYAKVNVTLDAQSPGKIAYRDSFRSESTMVIDQSFDDANITSVCDATIARGTAPDEIEFKLKCSNLKGKFGLSHFEIGNFKTTCKGT